MWDSNVNSERINFCRLDCGERGVLRERGLDVLGSYYTELEDGEESDLFDGVELGWKVQSCKECDGKCRTCFGPGPGDCDSCGEGYDLVLKLDNSKFLRDHDFMSSAWKFELGADQGIKWAQKEAYCRDIPKQTIPHLVFGLDSETKSDLAEDIFRIAKNLEEDLFADGSPMWPDRATPAPLPQAVFGPVAASATGIEFNDQIGGTGTKLTINKITNYMHSKFDTRIIFDAVLLVKGT